MATVNEALGGKPLLGGVLADGVRALSLDQSISFSLYRKFVFALDGMVYWLKVPASTTTVATAGLQAGAGLASATVAPGEAIQVVPGGLGARNVAGGVIVNPLSAADQGLATAEPLFVDFTGPAYGSEKLGTVALAPGEHADIPPQPAAGAWVNAASAGHRFTVVVQQKVASVSLPTTFTVKGSFHYDSAIEQREDAVVDSNTVVFSALEEVQPFNQIGPDYLYIGTYGDLTFAFSSRGRLYEQADLYHYLGKALYSVNATQIVEDASKFEPTLVVSNSLPVWLNMPNYVPPYPGFTCPLPLYPSFLVTDNLPPPFGSVHIEDSVSLVAAPSFGRLNQQAQLKRDKVRVTLYGADAAMAASFLAFVEEYSHDWMLIGMAGMPGIVDEKQPQPEMQILAQRKRIDFDVSYNEAVSRDQARQFILHAKVQYIPAWLIN